MFLFHISICLSVSLPLKAMKKCPQVRIKGRGAGGGGRALSRHFTRDNQAEVSASRHIITHQRNASESHHETPLNPTEGLKSVRQTISSVAEDMEHWGPACCWQDPPNNTHRSNIGHQTPPSHLSTKTHPRTCITTTADCSITP